MKQLEWYKEILRVMKELDNFDPERIKEIENKVKDLESKEK